MFMNVESVSLLRLRVVAEADPAALQRVLERFQNLNVLPRRVIAEFGTSNTFHIRVDIAGLSEERLSRIAAKIEQAPCVLSAYWSRG
jgi:(p)ppGpp synthase/HD superfamily hydrolase